MVRVHLIELFIQDVQFSCSLVLKKLLLIYVHQYCGIIRTSSPGTNQQYVSYGSGPNLRIYVFRLVVFRELRAQGKRGRMSCHWLTVLTYHATLMWFQFTVLFQNKYIEYKTYIGKTSWISWVMYLIGGVMARLKHPRLITSEIK